MEGFIKLHRGLLKWEWYKDQNTKDVFLHLLLNANWEDSRYRGFEVPKGSLIIGRKKIAEELGISEQSVRTALEHLKSTNEITIKSTNKFSIATIVNWEKYQCWNEESTNKSTSESTNEQPTTNHIKEYKNIRNKEIKNIKSFTPPSLEEVKAYCSERHNNIDANSFINFYESKGWMVGKNKMKDWKACVRTWENRRNEKPKQEGFISGNYDFDALEKEARMN